MAFGSVVESYSCANPIRGFLRVLFFHACTRVTFDFYRIKRYQKKKLKKRKNITFNEKNFSEFLNIFLRSILKFISLLPGSNTLMRSKSKIRVRSNHPRLIKHIILTLQTLGLRNEKGVNRNGIIYTRPYPFTINILRLFPSLLKRRILKKWDSWKRISQIQINNMQRSVVKGASSEYRSLTLKFKETDNSFPFRSALLQYHIPFLSFHCLLKPALIIKDCYPGSNVKREIEKDRERVGEREKGGRIKLRMRLGVVRSSLSNFGTTSSR